MEEAWKSTHFVLMLAFHLMTIQSPVVTRFLIARHIWKAYLSVPGVNHTLVLHEHTIETSRSCFHVFCEENLLLNRELNLFSFCLHSCTSPACT